MWILCLFSSQDNMVKSNIDKKFSAHYDAVEAELKSSTVGNPTNPPVTPLSCSLPFYSHVMTSVAS